MEDLDEMLTCAVCLDFFKSPRKLPCPHVYCLECLRGLLNEHSAVLQCPECRIKHVIPNVDGLPMDYRIVKLLDIQKNLSISCVLSKKTEVGESSEAETASSAAKEPVTDTDVENVNLEGVIIRECRELFSQIQKQETKEVMLKQKELLKKKKAVIKNGRKLAADIVENMKKDLDKRLNELNLQLDEQAEKIDEELKKFDYMDTISEDLTKYKNSLFEKCSHNDMLRVHNQFQESKLRITNLLSIGTSYKALNSVSFEKTIDYLTDAIQKFGELVEMELPQLENEMETLQLEPRDYNKKWEVCAVSNEESSPWGVTINPYSGHFYVTFDFGTVVYDQDGKVVKRYKTDDTPRHVTFDKNQRMFVTSLKDKKVKIYNREGLLMYQFGSHGKGPEQFDEPYDIVIDSDKRIFIADPANSRVQVYNLDGDFIYTIACVGEKMKLPTFLHIDNNEPTGKCSRLFVSDPHLHKVLVFDVKDGHYCFVNDVTIQTPRGVCQDSNGNLLVASVDDKAIYVMNNELEQIARISEPDVAMVNPRGIAINDNGVMCVTSIQGKVYFIHQPET